MKKTSFVTVSSSVAIAAMVLVFPLYSHLNSAKLTGRAPNPGAQEMKRSDESGQASPYRPQAVSQAKSPTTSELQLQRKLQLKAQLKSQLESQLKPQEGMASQILNTNAEPQTVPVVSVKPSSTLVTLKPALGLSREVVGYFAEDWPGDTASFNSVKRYGDKLSGIATFSFRLNKNGSLTGTSPSLAVRKAHSAGSRAMVLVHNYMDGKFDSTLVHRVITDPARRKSTASNILKAIKSGNFDGVNIDFENIPAADRASFTQFISEVTGLLHQNGYLVTISVPAKTSDTFDSWGGAYDYGKLGKKVDRMMLMTYDEHWFGGNPGPVASIGWVEQVIRYAVSQVPASKVLLGLGVYGYEWDSNSGISTRSLPAAKALKLAYQYGADIKWDSSAQVPYFYYWPNGKKHVVWFESNNSAAFKMNLVNRYNLAGVAIWRLGFEDEGFWRMISEKFGDIN